MEKGTRKIAHFLHIIIAIAIFTSAISPACAFISGKETIEICTAFGVKTIEIDTQSPDDTTQNSMHMMPDCMFCFALSSPKDTNTYQSDYSPIITKTVLSSSINSDHIETSRALETYGARAPPIFA